MFQRISQVKSLTAKSVIFSSGIQIGDSSFIDSTSKVIAVQRNSDLPFRRTYQFSDYPIFFKPTTLPILNEPIRIHFENPCPFIKAGNIRIIGLSTSSLANIGNSKHIRLQTRIKHIRDLTYAQKS